MRSPLKDKPLRNPGESLDEQITEFAFDILFYLMIACMFIMLASMEWIQHLNQSPPNPILFSSMALVAIIYAFIKVRPIIKKLKRYKLGRDGEKAVGQFLEILRKDNAKIFHDIRADNFNIDHVVISEKGIYVVETKSWSKPSSGESLIQFDGQTLTKNGFVVEPSPTLQAIACSKYLSELLLETTGKKFIVQPVVTFPGWYVEQTSSFSKAQPWVLNPKGLAKFIRNAENRLSSDDANLVAYHLSRHIRTC